jgi:hypothetical protein
MARWAERPEDYWKGIYEWLMWYEHKVRVGHQVFKGVKDPPRNKIDIVAIESRINREYAIISMKWSIRHDRRRDLLDECTFYKNNARLPFYFVVTNEYNPGRLNITRQNHCINGVFPVNRNLLLAVNGGNGRREGIQDLTEVFQYFR